MWSPFFDRTFNSQFPVANSGVFLIDPDDSADYEPLCAALKHIYGITLTEHPDNYHLGTLKPKDRFGFYIKIYTLADKYDLPTVRRAVIDNLRTHSQFGEFDSAEGLPGVAQHVAHICGPDAPQLADAALRNFLFEWVVKSFEYMGETKDIDARLKDGSLLDAELTTRLLFRLGERVRESMRITKKRRA